MPESGLTLRRAREMVAALRGPGALFALLVECRSATAAETVIFEVEVERPQVVAHAIKKTERLAAVFARDDDCYPDVLALRPDFPVTQHQNQRFEELPRSLCLYDRPWFDVRLTWTAPAFVERVRWWLKQAARDELHAGDQGLEPFLLSWGHWLVLPAPSAEPGKDAESFLVSTAGSANARVLLAQADNGKAPLPGMVRFVVLRFQAPARPHRVMPRIPRTLGELAELLKSTDFDLLSAIRKRLKAWPKERELHLRSPAILLIDLPKTRTDDGPVEVVEHRAVWPRGTLLDLGVAVGTWSVQDGKRAVLVIPDLSKTGADVELDLLNVCDALTRTRAGVLNGLEGAIDSRILAIGAGSLGSHVAMNLARAGWGRWTVVDSDDLLPHNLARHVAHGALVGWRKAEALAFEMNWVCQDPAAASFIDTDVLRPGPEAERLAAAAREADLILDMSASIAVARHLAAIDCPGRRVSLFLAPSGRDLVLLAESEDRSVVLDHIEMMYYSAAALDERLAGHLENTAERVRYGLSCRDVSSRISHDSVVVLAGIGSSAVRDLMKHDAALAQVWRFDEGTLAVRSVPIEIELFIAQAHGDWTLQVAPAVLKAIRTWRMERLPNETGGVLLGRVDHERQVVYLVLALPSPPDSREWPMQYIRGCEDLRKKVESIEERTALNLGYVGEWHSHPDGAATMRSEADMQVFAWIREHTAPEGKPAVMLIAGDGGRSRVFIDVPVAGGAPEELCLR